MEKRILSPIKTWENFNPVQASLEVSIVNTYMLNDIIVNELFFTAEEIDDEKLRVFAVIAFKGEQSNNCPVAMVIPDASGMPTQEIIENVVNSGTVFASFNYTGIGKEGKTTVYPKILDYAIYDDNKDLCEVESDSIHTSWFVWTKIARRFITLLRTQFVNPNIALIGINLGGNIGWQVAGTDGRVKCFVSINGGGYLESLDYFKYGNSKINDKNNTSWLAGVAPQAYARFVNCPILYVGGSNCPTSDMDKIQDLLAVAPSENKYMCISPISEGEISLECANSIKSWINRFLIDNEFIVNTQIAYKNSEGKLYLNINVIEKDHLEKIKVYFSEKEFRPSIRNWHKKEDFTALGNGEFIVPINARSINNRVYCYVNTYFTNGIILTSKLATVIPKEIGIEEDKLVIDSPSRIIFNGSMGTHSFSANINEPVLDRYLMKKEKGAFGIEGITTLKGDLYTFKVGDIKYRSMKNCTLQLDAFSKTDREIEIIVFNFEDEKLIPYKVNVFLKDSDQWQKLTMVANDFKNPSMVSLSNFIDIKKIMIKNANNVIFNNILWV